LTSYVKSSQMEIKIGRMGEKGGRNFIWETGKENLTPWHQHELEWPMSQQ